MRFKDVEKAAKKKPKEQTFGQRLWEILDSDRPNDIKYPMIMNLLLETHVEKSVIKKRIAKLEPTLKDRGALFEITGFGLKKQIIEEIESFLGEEK